MASISGGCSVRSTEEERDEPGDSGSCTSVLARRSWRSSASISYSSVISVGRGGSLIWASRASVEGLKCFSGSVSGERASAVSLGSDANPKLI